MPISLPSATFKVVGGVQRTGRTARGFLAPFSQTVPPPQIKSGQQMSQCSFTKPNGERCKLAAQGPQGVCWNHDPKNAEQRRRQASKAATAKADKEVREVKGEIRDLVRLVREEDFDVSKANAINRLYNTLLAYILAERGIYREEDLAVRIRQLGEGK